MSAICIIPARGGSVRVPRKNIRPFMGKPMLARAIEVARASGIFNSILVSTEDQEIEDLAYSLDANIHHRHRDQDDIGTQELMRRILNELGAHNELYDYAACLYPCSPLLEPTDLSLAMGGLLAHPRLDYAMSVGTSPLCDAGNFYLGKSGAFRAGASLIGVCTMMVPIPPERCCDVNLESDWIRAEQLYKELHP